MSKNNHISNGTIEEVISEFNNHGYSIDTVNTDGRIHRFGPKKTMWYVVYENIVQTSGKTYYTAVYGDWRTGEKFIFNSRNIIFSPEDRESIKLKFRATQAEVEKVRSELYREVADEVGARWKNFTDSGTTPYLVRKKIEKLLGAKRDGETLYVPVRDIEGTLWSIQTIFPDETKLFEKDSKVSGCFHLIGEIESNNDVFITEGFATAATVFLATNKPTVAAFNAGNLLGVAELFKEKYPFKNFIIAGDDDRWTLKRGSLYNTGKEAAKKASKAVNGIYILPKFADLNGKPTDFNDLHYRESLEEVRRQLSKIPPPQEPKGKPSQAKTLIELCEDVELFHTADDRAYSTIKVGTGPDVHNETWALRSDGFGKWLRQRFYEKTRSAPSSQAFQDALGVLEGKASFEGQKKNVFLRIAELNGNVYLDLSNENWEVVEISRTGWRIIANSPVKFWRPKTMLALPRPVSSNIIDENTIREFRKFLNLETEEDFRLVTGWLVNTYNPRGPYLTLVLYGEQGSAKTTTVRVLRELIDPNIAPLRQPPQNSEDLMLSAKNNWTVVMDNMSHLPAWLSDDLCRLATGGAFGRRQKYSDDEETIFEAKRASILNGIDEFVVRGDLASRSLIINLPTITETERKTEKVFWEQFDKLKPQFLGLFLNAISTALANENSLEIENQSRMADAWHWVSASETSFGWEKGSILKAFRKNQAAANEVVLNSSPIYPFINILSKRLWTGTAESLLREINQMRGEGLDSTAKHFPNDPKTLSDRLRRITPPLRMAGIDVTFERSSGLNSKRIITIRKIKDSCVASVANDLESIIHMQRDAGDAENYKHSSGVKL